MFEFENEDFESKIQAEVGYQQGTERSLSRAANSIGGLAAMFAAFSTMLLDPISWFSDSVDRFQDVILSGVSTFTSLIDSLFVHLSQLDDILAQSSISDIYQVLKYITGMDLLIPFYVDYVSPIFIVILFCLTTFLILAVSLCVSVVIFNIIRRLISILPFFKAI